MATFELSWSAREKKVEPAGSDQLLSDVILYKNIKWFIQLRWIVVVVFLVLQQVALHCPEYLEQLDIHPPGLWPLGAAIGLALTNLCFFCLNRHPSEPLLVSPNTHLWLQITSDLICLTLVVHFSGCTTSPVPFFYLVHIALACIFFPVRASLCVMLLATLLYLLCVFLEYAGVWPLCNIFVIPEHQSDAVIFWKSSSVVALMAIIWYVVSRMSLTVRLREQRLLQAEEETRAAQREKEMYAMQMTHQLKSPLDVIRSHISLVKEGYAGEVSPEVMEMLQNIDLRAQSLSDLVMDVLKLSKLRLFQKENAKWETVSLDVLLQHTIVELGPLAQTLNITIQTDMENIEVSGVVEQLLMMFHNLLTNALRYSYENATVNISCHWQEKLPVVIFRDHGIGISAQDLPKLFQEYHRTKEAIKHNKMSTGIGLAIVKKIAEIHGICIRVESQLTQGTSFSLIFPSSQQQ